MLRFYILVVYFLIKPTLYPLLGAVLNWLVACVVVRGDDLGSFESLN